jgi:transposase InsO family protein
MKSDDPIDRSERIALRRFACTSRVEERVRQGVGLCHALTEVADSSHLDDQGRNFRVAVRTLEDWWYAWQKGGFAALHPKARRDRGRCRRLDSEQQRWILEQISTHPKVPVKVLYRGWIEQGRSLPPLNTIYRFLRNQDPAVSVPPPQSGPTKAFEAPQPNDLWMVDFSPGPFLKVPDSRKTLQTHLCLIIDDHSRLIPFAAYSAKADTAAFHAVLKEALKRRGIPYKLYTDQGGPFCCDHTKIVCANLGIRLRHARPYHAWSKGKVERVFRTLQQDFEISLPFSKNPPRSLEELNTQLSVWLQSVYHCRKHSTTGQSPAARFNAHSQHLRSPDPSLELDRLFFMRENRRVRKNGIVVLDKQLYEVDLSLRSLKVQLRFDPADKRTIEVFYRNAFRGYAQLLDAHLNSQLYPPRDYDKDNPES